MNKSTTPALIAAVAELEALVAAEAFRRLGRSAHRGTELAGMTLPSDLEPVPIEDYAVYTAADGLRRRQRELAGSPGVQFANETISKHPHNTSRQAES